MWLQRHAGGSNVGTPVVVSGTEPASDAAVASDGTNVLVVWSRGNGSLQWDISARLFSAAGAALTPIRQVTATAGNQRKPEVAWGGGRYLIVWEDTRKGGL